jgi:hypothetical protein
LMAYMTGVALGSPYASNPSPEIYSTWVSDVWGWTDPVTGKEYALVGMWDGTSIVDVSDPIHPKTVVFVETTFGTTDGLDGQRNFWRHIKVIGNVMYVGAETSNHGLQAFDLTSLRPKAPDEPEEGFFVKVWLVKIWEFMIWLFSAIKGKIGNFLGFSDDDPTPDTSTIPIVSPTYVTPEIGSNHNLVAVPEAGKIIVTGMLLTDKTCPGKNLGTPSATVAALAIFDIATDPLRPGLNVASI